MWAENHKITKCLPNIADKHPKWAIFGPKWTNSGDYICPHLFSKVGRRPVKVGKSTIFVRNILQISPKSPAKMVSRQHLFPKVGRVLLIIACFLAHNIQNLICFISPRSNFYLNPILIVS